MWGRLQSGYITPAVLGAQCGQSGYIMPWCLVWGGKQTGYMTPASGVGRDQCGHQAVPERGGGGGDGVQYSSITPNFTKIPPKMYQTIPNSPFPKKKNHILSNQGVCGTHHRHAMLENYHGKNLKPSKTGGDPSY